MTITPSTLTPPTAPDITLLNNSLRPVLRELERVYLAASHRMADANPKLQPLLDQHPVIVIQTHGAKRNLLGWCAASQWARHEDGTKPATSVNEITVTAESLNRPPEEVAETIIHEAVHHANSLLGVKDCGNNQYHNKKFRTLAEEFGLTVEKMGNRGWAHTVLGEPLKLMVDGLKLDADAFRLARIAVGSVKPKSKTKMKKWECDCGHAVRAAVELNITCNVCGKKLVLSDDEETMDGDDGARDGLPGLGGDDDEMPVVDADDLFGPKTTAVAATPA